MKTISLILIAAVLGCGNTSEGNTVKESTNTASVSTESTENTESTEEQETILTGKISKEDLQSEPHADWFNEKYGSYKPAPESLKKIASNIGEFEIEVFMGTWCADSRWEIPKLFKLLEEANYDLDRLTVYAVDRNKQLPENAEVSTEFEMVPTIVFYKNGEEVNRFVEFPQETLEKDIAKIVSGEEYVNPYAE